MIKWFLVILLLFIWGCKSINTVDSYNNTSIVKMKYDENSKTFYEDQWDIFIRGIKEGTVVFTWSKAIICYLVSNVKFVILHPEENLDIQDKLCVQIIIFRWNW